MLQLGINIGQRFTFKSLSDEATRERQAVVTRVLSNREEGFGPEVGFYIANWVEAHEARSTTDGRVGFWSGYGRQCLSRRACGEYHLAPLVLLGVVVSSHRLLLLTCEYRPARGAAGFQ